MSIRITDRQREVLCFIRTFADDHGYPPTLRNIGQALGITSTNGVNDHLVALEKRGLIARDRFVARSIVLTYDGLREAA